MAEQMVLTQEQLDKRFKDYMAKHQAEIDELIDRRINTAVKSAITDAFSTYNGTARESVKQVIQGRIKKLSAGITIDDEDLLQRLNKKVATQVNKASVSIKFD